MNKLQYKVTFGTMNISDMAKTTIGELLRLDAQVTNGVYVKEFESLFAKSFNRKYAIAVSSGTDANTIALAALYRNWQDGEIIIPALTFVATANSVINAGLIPKFVDVELDTLNIDADLIEDAINPGKTRAIMPVHLMGKPCNMHKIMSIAKEYQLGIVEDCAEAHGARYYAMSVGTFGLLGCYSLYAAHIVSSIEGGMIVTDDPILAEKCRNLRNHGLKLDGTNWTFDQIGYSSKMNEIEAIVGIGNIHNLDSILRKRRFNFDYLTEKFTQFSEHLFTIKPGEYDTMGPHAFAIIVNPETINKQKFVEFLSSKGIDNRNLFYSIPTQAECYEYLGYKTGDFPNAEFLSENGTHIGCHQDLTIDQLNYVVESIKEFICLNITK